MTEGGVHSGESRNDDTRGISDINGRLTSRRLYPFRRFVLFSGGAPLRLLKIVPIEETEFLVQGTGVIVAAVMAGLGGAVASRMFEPVPDVWVSVVIGTLVGTLIYTIDRLLVRGSLRPHEFPPDVLAALWDPYADAKWYQVISGGSRANSIFSRVKGFFTVFGKVFIRLLLAGLISYVVADVVAIAVFKPTVDARATQIKIEERQQLIDEVEVARAARNSRIDEARAADEAIQNADPTIQGALSQRDAAQARVDALSRDIALLQGIINAETNGNVTPQVELSDGTNFPNDRSETSGIPGCRELCQQATDKQDAVSEQLDAAEGDLESRQALYDEALANASLVDLLSTYQALYQASEQQYQEDLARIPSDVTPNDLLIRRVALHQLANDARPWTPGIDPVEECSPAWSWLCEAKRFVLPNTPLGSFVGAFRAILFLIDILPITLKIYFALRQRRPYDVLVAALEEASVADSINKLDHELNHSGQQMEDRAVARRGNRHTAGARVLRERFRGQERESENYRRAMRRDVQADYDSSVRRDWRTLQYWRDAMKGTKSNSRQTRNLTVVENDSSPWRRVRSYREGPLSGDPGAKDEDSPTHRS